MQKASIFITQFLVSLVCPLLYAQRPEGLRTDLVTDTETVWCGGYATDLSLPESTAAGQDRFQVVRIRSSRPSLSWVVPGRAPSRQTSWRVVMSSSAAGASASEGDVWDSGWVDGAGSVAVPYGGAPLEPSKVYYWKVKVKTDTGGESEWSAAKSFMTAGSLEEYATPACPLVKERQSPSLLEDSDGVKVLDFGRDAFGQLLLTLSSDTGADTVVVHIGERLQDGRVMRKPTTSVRYRRNVLPLRKGTHTYRLVNKPDRRNTSPGAVLMPAFIGEVVPFRYCEIEGYRGPFVPSDAVREAVSYPFDDAAASFASSDPVLDQVWELCRYSVKATSFAGLFVDGDRERIPYEADALISQLCHYGADREYTLSRRTLEYLLEHPTWPTEWILQSVLIAWNDYLYTGDSRLLDRDYDVLRAHCLESLVAANGLVTTSEGQDEAFLKSIRRREKVRDIVDWPHSGGTGLAAGTGGEDDGFVYTDYNAVVNAYAYRALSLMARIAEVTGRDGDASELSAKAERLRKAFNRQFFDMKQKRYVDGEGTTHASLHTNMFALLFGLVPEKYKAPVTRFILSRGMACSVYGAQFLLEALYEGGAAAEALDLMTGTSRRSWFNMLRAGSTITLEAWDDSFKPNQDWNHLWGAAPGNVIPFRLMGVSPLEPGFSKVLVKPQPGGLEHARMSIPTIRGTIFMEIKDTPQERSVSVDLPANMEAEIVLPEGFRLKDQNAAISSSFE